MQLANALENLAGVTWQFFYRHRVSFLEECRQPLSQDRPYRLLGFRGCCTSSHRRVAATINKYPFGMIGMIGTIGTPYRRAGSYSLVSSHRLEAAPQLVQPYQILQHSQLGGEFRVIIEAEVVPNVDLVANGLDYCVDAACNFDQTVKLARTSKCECSHFSRCVHDSCRTAICE